MASETALRKSNNGVRRGVRPLDEDDPREAILGPITLGGAGATTAWARRFSAVLKVGDVIGLEGDLGTGKTALVRAAVHAMGNAAEEVPSPTFTLVQTYELPDFTLWHFDLYRIGTPEEALDLGFDEAAVDGVVMVEWPDRLGPYWPTDGLILFLAYDDEPGTRVLTAYGDREWQRRLADLEAVDRG